MHLQYTQETKNRTLRVNHALHRQEASHETEIGHFLLHYSRVQMHNVQNFRKADFANLEPKCMQKPRAILFSRRILSLARLARYQFPRPRPAPQAGRPHPYPWPLPEGSPVSPPSFSMIIVRRLPRHRIHAIRATPSPL
jgi:hypothetical protein